jgi:hypothetical protein
MIVAVAVVRVMQVSVDEIVDVIPVGNGFMTAPWTVNMICGMTRAAVAAGASSRIGGVHI